MRKKVSVILPVYNGQKYIKQAVNSVRSQTHPFIELIVINDGSTDGSADIIKDLAPDIYVDQQNQGVAQTRAVGLSRATGDFIAFIDQDDMWTPDKLEKQLKALRESPDSQYAYCQQKIFLEEGVAKPNWAKDEWFDKPQEGKLPSAFIVRSEFLAGFDLIDTSLHMTSDIDMFIRLQDAGVPCIEVKEPLVLRRIHKMNHSADAAAVKSEVMKTLRLAMLRRRNKTND